MATAVKTPLPNGSSDSDAPASPEQSWLSRHVAGDAAAFGELMQAYASPLYGYLTRCCVTASERDDLLQEIFTRVHTAAPRFDASRPLRPWLYTIAANTVRNHIRDRRKVVDLARDEGGATVEAAASAGGAPDRVFEARATAEWVEDELAELPLPQREVLVLCAIEQMTYAEVAEILGTPVNTVRTHLRRARLTLAQKLARRRLAVDREVTS